MNRWRSAVTQSPSHRVTAFLAVFMWSGIVWACPLCKEALFDPTQARQAAGTAKGYAISISLLLGMPLLLVGGVATALIRQAKRPSPRVDTRNRSE